MSAWAFATEVVKLARALLAAGFQRGPAAGAPRPTPAPRGLWLRRGWLRQLCAGAAAVLVCLFFCHGHVRELQRQASEGIRQRQTEGVMNMVESLANAIEDILQYGPYGRGRPSAQAIFVQDAHQLSARLQSNARAAIVDFARLAELTRLDAEAGELEYRQEAALVPEIHLANEPAAPRAQELEALVRELNEASERLDRAGAASPAQLARHGEARQRAMRATALLNIARHVAEALPDGDDAQRLSAAARRCALRGSEKLTLCAASQREHRRRHASAIAQRVLARAGARLERAKEESIKNLVRRSRFGADGHGYFFLYSDDTTYQRCVAHGASLAREGLPFGNLPADERTIITDLRHNAGRDDARGTLTRYLFPKPEGSTEDRHWKVAYSRYILAPVAEGSGAPAGHRPEKQPYKRWWLGGGLYPSTDEPLHPEYAAPAFLGLGGVEPSWWLYPLPPLSLLYVISCLCRRKRAAGPARASSAAATCLGEAPAVSPRSVVIAEDRSFETGC